MEWSAGQGLGLAVAVAQLFGAMAGLAFVTVIGWGLFHDLLERGSDDAD